MFEPLLRTITARDSSLAPASLKRLVEAFDAPKLIAAGVEIVRQGSRPMSSTLLLHSWASRYSSLANGRRQTLALRMAGDFFDLHSFPLRTVDHGVVALTDCTVASIPHSTLRRFTETDARLARLLWVLTQIDGAILRRWLRGAGQQPALEHAAHLFCELFVAAWRSSTGSASAHSANSTRCTCRSPTSPAESGP